MRHQPRDTFLHKSPDPATSIHPTRAMRSGNESKIVHSAIRTRTQSRNGKPLPLSWSDIFRQIFDETDKLGRDQSHLFPCSRVAPPNRKILSECVTKPLTDPQNFLYLWCPFLAEDEPECNFGDGWAAPLVRTGLLQSTDQPDSSSVAIPNHLSFHRVPPQLPRRNAQPVTRRLLFLGSTCLAPDSASLAVLPKPYYRQMLRGRVAKEERVWRGFTSAVDRVAQARRRNPGVMLWISCESGVCGASGLTLICFGPPWH